MVKTIKEQTMHYLLKEIRRSKTSLWNAMERKAPEREISDLRRKLSMLDWLMGLAIKEEDEIR